jgi:hypothetical protein
MGLRVVIKEFYSCTVCGERLTYKHVRMWDEKRLILFHPGNGCKFGGKRYHAPGVDLDEITPAAWKASR